MQRRPYQDAGVKWILDRAVENPRGRLLVVGPPGCGKTVIAAVTARIMAHDNDLPALVVAHRRELINQHFDHLLRCGVPEADVGVIMARDKRTRPSAPIQVASIDTLNRRNKPEACLVITDEAQRDASKTRRKLRALYKDALRLGLTACPERLGHQSLRDDFDDLLMLTTPAELIEGGWYAAPRVYTVPEDLLPELTKVRTVRGDYEVSGLEHEVIRKVLIGAIVEHWNRHAGGRSTVAFAVSIEHSKHIVEQFIRAGIRAAHLDESTPSAKRASLLDAFKRGEIKVVSCVNILSEGWDSAQCKCNILARPTKSLNMFIQQTGRSSRPLGSVEPVILDHAGNTMKHGLPHAERQWSLDGLVRPTGYGYHAPVKICGNSECCAVVPAAAHTCPECGFEFQIAERVREETDDKLALFKLDLKEEKAELLHIVEFAEKRGFPHEWAKKVFVAKFGHEPRVPWPAQPATRPAEVEEDHRSSSA